MKDINLYNEEMSKSLEDKAFFIEHFKFATVLDYGCADARLFEFLDAHCQEGYDYVGYDISKEMYVSAKRRNPNIPFFRDITKLAEEIKDEKTVALVANSVLHEMFSEGVESDFFKHVDLIKPEFIVIRDMFLTEDLKRTKSEEKDIRSLLDAVDPEMIADYESYVGSIKTYKYLIQLIFKARFKANWETELSDDYFAINRATLLYVIDLLGYEIAYQEDYTLAFLQQHAKKKYEIDLSFPTHFKIIATKKEE